MGSSPTRPTNSLPPLTGKPLETRPFAGLSVSGDPSKRSQPAGSSQKESQKEASRFRLVLVSVPDSRPVIVRLRAALKTLLRRYGFRCESVEAVPDEEARAPPSRAGLD